MLAERDGAEGVVLSGLTIFEKRTHISMDYK